MRFLYSCIPQTFVCIIGYTNVSPSLPTTHGKFQYDLAWEIIYLRVLNSDTKLHGIAPLNAM